MAHSLLRGGHNRVSQWENIPPRLDCCSGQCSDLAVDEREALNEQIADIVCRSQFRIVGTGPTGTRPTLHVSGSGAAEAALIDIGLKPGRQRISAKQATA